jgi:hypothetical protein
MLELNGTCYFNIKLKKFNTNFAYRRSCHEIVLFMLFLKNLFLYKCVKVYFYKCVIGINRKTELSRIGNDERLCDEKKDKINN